MTDFAALYAERLTLAVNYCREQFAESHAEGLLRDFVNRIESSVALADHGAAG